MLTAAIPAYVATCWFLAPRFGFYPARPVDPDCNHGPWRLFGAFREMYHWLVLGALVLSIVCLVRAVVTKEKGYMVGAVINPLSLIWLLSLFWLID